MATSLGCVSKIRSASCCVRPRTASVVYDIERYQWGDSKWLEARALGNRLDFG